jgi:ABC-type phosphate/phosphonate transport system substrate-binding protein
MAYMSQERKAQIAPVIKAICKKYGIKASLAVRHHSALVLNIKQGDIDFIGNYNATIAERDPTGNRHINAATRDIQVNTYWYHEHFTGRAKKFLEEVIAAMNAGNHDRSDIQTDYFDVGWYIDVNIGQWNKPYALVK